jgi:hypothetical protein
LTEFQVTAAKERFDKLAANKLLRYGSPVSTRYLFRFECHKECFFFGALLSVRCIKLGPRLSLRGLIS